METLVEIEIYRDVDSVTVYLNDHKVVGPEPSSSELILETHIKLKDLKAALADYLEE